MRGVVRTAERFVDESVDTPDPGLADYVGRQLGVPSTEIDWHQLPDGRFRAVWVPQPYPPLEEP